MKLVEDARLLGVLWLKLRPTKHLTGAHPHEVCNACQQTPVRWNFGFAFLNKVQEGTLPGDELCASESVLLGSMLFASLSIGDVAIVLAPWLDLLHSLWLGLAVDLELT